MKKKMMEKKQEKEGMDNFNIREERYFEKLFEEPKEEEEVKGGRE